MAPRISICLPTFNAEPFLNLALESLYSQTYGDFEIVLVDDGSTDATRELIQDHARKDKRIRFFSNKQNLGLFANYNRCIQYAEGEFIKTFAQDDLLHPEALESCLEVFDREENVVLVSVARQFINESGQPLDLDLPSAAVIVQSDTVVPGAEVIRKSIFPIVNYIGEPSAVMYRRRAAGEGFDPAFRHLGDVEYWLRILMEGDYYFLPQQLCCFRRHRRSTSSFNLRGLMVGPDLVRFARKFAWVLESCGFSEEEFIRNSIRFLGEFVKSLAESGNIDLANLRQAEDLRGMVSESVVLDPSVTRLIQDLTDFRELSFHCLRLLAESDLRSSATESGQAAVENEKMIRSLESELRLLLQSRSWRMTRLLREFNKFNSSAGNDEEEGEFKIDSDGDILSQQLAYADHLRNTIEKVKLSRSWRLTKPFRDSERKSETEQDQS